jgi:ribosomal protein L10
VSLSSLRYKLRDQNAELIGLKNELARKYQEKNNGNKPFSEKDQKYRHMVEDATKVRTRIA